MTTHNVVNSIYFKAASLQRENLPPGEDAFRRKTKFSNVKMLAKW